jgi:hypothetical protein
MNTLPSLLAARGGAELIETLVVLVLVVGGAIFELVMRIRQAQRPGGPPRPQPPPRPAVKDVAGEIDDFLRRAAQQRAGQQGTAQPPRPTRPQPAKPTKPPAPPPQQPLVAQVVAPAPVGGQVTEHVQKYLDTEEFTRRGAQMGGEVVSQVDREIDQHLHQVFDHSVSQLAAIPGETAAAPVAYEPLELSDASAIAIPATFATGLTDLLTSPESIRQAIVLNEILHRPEERW